MMLLLVKSEAHHVSAHTRSGHHVREYIRRADKFADLKHKGQLRKDGKTPYIYHPRDVARILTQEGGVADHEIIAAALLHDVIEDTGTSRDEIEKEFGPRVADLVVELTNDPNLSGDESKREQLKREFSPAAAMVKIGDKTSNLRSILTAPPTGWSREKKMRYFDHAAELVERIGHHHPVLKNVFLQTLARKKEV